MSVDRIVCSVPVRAHPTPSLAPIAVKRRGSLLAFFVSPWMEIKHCLSFVGYSFFSWSLALLISYPLERYQETLKIFPSLPLVCLGLPAALAQGYLFWEYVPNSTMTLKPSKLHRSLQRCAQDNSMCIQRILWAAPKVRRLSQANCFLLTQFGV